MGWEGGKERRTYLVLQVAVVAIELLRGELTLVGEGLVGEGANEKVLQVRGELGFRLDELADAEHLAVGREGRRKGWREEGFSDHIRIEGRGERQGGREGE